MHRTHKYQKLEVQSINSFKRSEPGERSRIFPFLNIHKNNCGVYLIEQKFVIFISFITLKFLFLFRFSSMSMEVWRWRKKSSLR